MEETLKDSEKTNLPGKILTGSQDRFAVSEQARNRIIAFETGEKTVTAWVDTNNQLANDVLSTISQMEASGYQVQIVPVDMGLIRSSYAHESGEGDTSEQQSLAMSIFRNAADENASDIHIVTTRTNQSRILFRINGDLEEQPSYTRSYEQGIQLIRTIYNSMASEGSNNFRIDGKLDGRISKRQFLPETVESIRVSAVGLNNNDHSTVLRLLYNSSIHDVSFEGLGYDTIQVAKLSQITRRPYGCCIISGPTGSGKSTTLKGLLQKIITDYNHKKNVLTVEDPCEYPINGARQTSVYNANTEEERRTAYSASITAAMRHDPDVIMIGEIRDKASAELAFSGAKTGHLLPASLHANNAMAIPGRLIDLGIKPEDVYDPTLLVAMISQRLIKVICPKCKQKLTDCLDKFPQAELSRMKRVLGTLDTVYVCGPGCPKCRNGIIDRTVVSEIIIPDEKLMQLIHDGKRPEALHYWQNTLHGMTMNDHAISKIHRGEIDPFLAEVQLGELQPVFDRSKS